MPTSDFHMRLRYNRRFLILSLLVFAVAGVGSWQVATRITDRIEDSTERQFRTAFTAEGQDWASFTADGLMLHLGGSAPNEVARFHALTIANGLIDKDRVVDETKLAERDFLEPPDFKLEVMRQGPVVSLIGLLPKRTNREELTSRLASGGINVTDLTSAAAFPPPENWQSVIDFAVSATKMSDQVTVSVTPELVRITANASSLDDKQQIESALESATPAGVSTNISVSAPLPVISPFRLRFIHDGENIALERCASENEADRDLIIAAAIAAGTDEDIDCILGIGAPSGWGQAASAGIASIARLGAGTLEMSDGKIRIILPAAISRADQDTETERLTDTLPDGFTLSFERAEPPPTEGPVRFIARLDSDDGPASISGVVHDPTMRQTVQSLARAQLGPVEGKLALDPGLRDDWALRVMAGLDAMGVLDLGDLEVSSDHIRLSGISGDRLAPEKAVAALAARLGAGADYTFSIAYDPRLDPEVVLPDGTTCVDRLNAVMLQSQIGFEPGGSTIAGDIAPVIEQLRPIMDECGSFQIELAGHTDSQGPDDANMTLSRERADAVLTALRDAGIPVQNMTAQGYGETRPIAENDTREGRETNRRIELTLVSPEPVPAPPPEAKTITGRTPSAEEAAETLQKQFPVAEEANLLPDLPDPAFDQDVLSTPPRIEPPATVLSAMPDTPRPPGRPQVSTSDSSSAAPVEEAQ